MWFFFMVFGAVVMMIYDHKRSMRKLNEQLSRRAETTARQCDEMVKLRAQQMELHEFMHGRAPKRDWLN